MNPQRFLSERLMEDLAPFAFVAMLAALIVLPAITLGIARKWSQSQPEVATGALTGAVVICVVGILTAALVFLAVIGWIPPLQQLLHPAS